jgi:hypothetical protein
MDPTAGTPPRLRPTADGSLGARLAPALIDLVIGLCTLSLLSSVLVRTTSVPRSTPPGLRAGRGPSR